MVESVFNSFDKPEDLAKSLLKACEQYLKEQPDFDKELQVLNDYGIKNDRKTTNMMRATFEFLAITMIAEAASPSDELKTQFIKDVFEVIDKEKRFPTQAEMPNLENFKDSTNQKNIKDGRSPAMDQLANGLLQEVHRTGVQIHQEFTSTKYPARGVVGNPGGKTKQGTKRGRIHLHDIGDDIVPSAVLPQQAARDHDGELKEHRSLVLTRKSEEKELPAH